LGLASSALLCATAAAQNDECAGAIAVTVGSTAFDTTTATPSALPWPCATGGGPDLWYSFTAPATGIYSIELCGSSYDTALELFSGTCASLLSVYCNDDFCGVQSGLGAWPLSSGDVLIFRVGGWQGSTGAGLIDIVQLPPIPPASGSVSAWLTAVGTGTAASYTNSDLPGPIEDDIGLTDGTNGVTYEFIVYGDNGGASSALMGALGSGIGDSAGLKFEQWNDTMTYGATEFGIADHLFALANTPNVDIQLVFVADTAAGTMQLYVDGVNGGTVPAAPILQGLQGIGQIYRVGGNLDVMWLGAIRGVAVYEAQLSLAEIDEHRNAYFMGSLGTIYCSPGVPNASGNPASIAGTGSANVATNVLTLTCADMPTSAFGFFLTSRSQGMVSQPGGSLGVLCLGGAIGRYVGPGQILNSGGSGEISLLLDLTATPTPTGLVSVLPGETWYFTTWFRDNVMGTPTSNFSDGVAIDFN